MQAPNGDDSPPHRDYGRVAAAIRYLDTQRDARPELAAVAAAIGLSPFHCQRLFVRWAGVSPKRFLQLLTVARAKQALRDSATVLDASYHAGMSGPGRLHDLFVTLEALTPGEYRAGGHGLTIEWGCGPTPFGPALLATTPRGICALHFDAGDDAFAALAAEWPRASFVRDDAAAARTLDRSFAADHSLASDAAPLRVLVRGTAFQTRVWRALMAVPPGAVTTYERIAAAAGSPGAARAAGQAIARNAVAFLIPCHRVIRSVGEFGGYRWDTVRKRALLAWEAARHDDDARVPDAAVADGRD